VKRVLLMLVVVGLAMAAPSLGNPFVFDDLPKIVENRDLDTLGVGRLIYPYSSASSRARNDPSRPLVFYTYALNKALSSAPWIFHLTDAVLHVLAAFLLFLVARRITPEVAPFLALVFLTHPLMFGVALYPYARAEILAAIFMLGGIVAWMQERRAITLACYVLALMSKQSAIVLPLLLLFIERRKVGPLFVVALIYLGLRAWLLGGLGDLEADPETLWSARRYMDAQPYVVLRYAQLILFPLGLSADHVVPELGIALRLLGWAFLVLCALAFWFRPRLRFGLAFFFLLLAPTSSLLPTADAMVERRAYLASAGLLFILAPLFADLDSRSRRTARVLGFVVIAAFVALSLRRGAIGDSEQHLWADVLETYPTNERGLLRLAQLSSDDEAAFALYDRLFALHPRHFAGYNSLGALYYRREQPALAERFFRFALEIRPSYAPARINLERITQASSAVVAPPVRALREEVGPPLTSAYKASLIENRALVVSLYRAQIEKHPETTKFRRKLIEMLLFIDRPDDALVELEALAAIEPDDLEVRRKIESLRAPR